MFLITIAFLMIFDDKWSSRCSGPVGMTQTSISPIPSDATRSNIQVCSTVGRPLDDAETHVSTNLTSSRVIHEYVIISKECERLNYQTPLPRAARQAIIN